MSEDQNIKPAGPDGKAESVGEPDGDASEHSSSPQNKNDKVTLYLKATGDAPIMKKKIWTVEKTRKVSEVAAFVRKYLKLEQSDNLFLFVNQAFAPAPDRTCGNLQTCYGTVNADGSPSALVLHYSKVQAWG